MAARPALGLVSLLFLAGGIVLDFFVILSGGVNRSPVNQFYFLEVETRGITPPPVNPARYTFFSICGVDNGLNANCGKAKAALPFDPRRNFQATGGIPPRFATNHGEYFTSRIMFAFFLMALLFAILGLITGLLAICTRIGAYISAVNAVIAWFFQIIAAATMTVWTVKGRNGFHSAGLNAKLGVKAYAFTWSAMACYLLATVLFCLGGSAHRDRGYGSRGVSRRRSTRSRGSFKQEYE